MAQTQVSDIFQPVIWNPYFIEFLTNKIAIIRSGIAAVDPEITQKVGILGDGVINMPFWDDLAHDTDATTRSKVPTDDATNIVPAKLTTGKDIAITNYRTQSWKNQGVVKYKAGDDPADVLIARYGTWWDQELQRILLLILEGVFGTALASTHVNDISTEDGDNATASNLISVNAVEGARFKLGDAYNKLTGMMMHSVVYQRMRLLNLIDIDNDSEQNLEISRYNGLEVIVDDDITTEAGSTSGTKYTTYLFGRGAVAFNPIELMGEDSNLEFHREPLEGTGAGSDTMITRNKFLMHLRGVKWAGTTAGLYPSDAELALAASWAKEFLDKNIRVTKLVTNG
jgi:hypothetical protein